MDMKDVVSVKSLVASPKVSKSILYDSKTSQKKFTKDILLSDEPTIIEDRVIGEEEVHPRIPKNKEVKPKKTQPIRIYKGKVGLPKMTARESLKYMTYSDILTIRPQPFRDLYDRVPKPQEALVDNGLPSWNYGPLDAKLTTIPIPKDECFYSRGTIGDCLWKPLDGGEFVFYDPYGFEISIPYDPLHDKHLIRFFQSPYNTQPLRTQQIINEYNKASCSLKEFNSYRKYLYKIYAEKLRNEYNAKVAFELEESMVGNALKNMRRDVKRQLKKEIIKKRQSITEEKRLAEQKIKEEMCLKRKIRFDNVQKKKEQTRIENILKAEQRDAIFRRRIQQRVTLAAEIELKRKVDAKVQTKLQDLNLKMKAEKRRQTKELEKETKIKERWDNKVNYQYFAIERERLIREMRENNIKKGAYRRLEKNKVQLKTRDDKFKEIVKKNKVEKKKKEKEGTKKSTRFSEEPDKRFSNAPKTIKPLVDRYKKHIGKASFVESDFTTMEQKVVPFEVAEALTELLTTTIKVYIRNQVEKSVKELIQKAFSLHEEQVRTWKKEKYSTLVSKRQSLMMELSCLTSEEKVDPSILFDNFEQGEDITKHVLLHLVSFNEHPEHIKVEELIDTTLKPIRERPPTPLPPAHFLDIKEPYEEDISYKAKLELLLYTLCVKVLDVLEARILSHFLESGDVATISRQGNLEEKEEALVSYITATFVFIIETVGEIDEDESVGEIARYIGKHILLL